MYINGGFSLPFYTVGSTITLVAIILIFILPKISTNDEADNGADASDQGKTMKKRNLQILDVIKVAQTTDLI